MTEYAEKTPNFRVSRRWNSWKFQGDVARLQLQVCSCEVRWSDIRAWESKDCWCSADRRSSPRQQVKERQNKSGRRWLILEKQISTQFMKFSKPIFRGELPWFTVAGIGYRCTSCPWNFFCNSIFPVLSLTVLNRTPVIFMFLTWVYLCRGSVRISIASEGVLALNETLPYHINTLREHKSSLLPCSFTHRSTAQQLLTWAHK